MNKMYIQINESHEKRQRYQMLTVFKVICALCVVYIHAYCGKSFFGNMFYTCFARQAVPFFFVTSGFLLGEKIQSDGFNRDYIIKYIRNILVVYGVWSALCLPHIISIYIEKNAGKSIIYTLFTIVRRLLFTGNSVYWYLLVLGESVLIIAVLFTYKKHTIFYWIVIPFILLGVVYEYQKNVIGILGPINKIIYYIFGSNDNVIMRGLPYCSLGFIISRNKEKCSFKSPKIFWLAYGGECIISMVLYYMVCPYDVGIMAPFQAVTLLLISLQYRDRVMNLIVEEKLRNISSVIYLVHIVFISFFPQFIIVKWGACYLLTIVCSLVLWFALEKTHNKFLKKIFLMS